MIGVRAMGVFCDDIREEVQGMHSLVGIYPDNVNVPVVPGMMPKLGMYVRIGFPPHGDIGPVSVWLQQSDGKETKLTDIEQELAAKTQREARDGGMPVGTVVSKAIIAPFPVLAFGRVKLIVRVGKEDFVCASLNFQRSPDAPVAVAPAAPATSGRREVRPRRKAGKKR